MTVNLLEIYVDLLIYNLLPYLNSESSLSPTAQCHTLVWTWFVEDLICTEFFIELDQLLSLLLFESPAVLAPLFLLTLPCHVCSGY